MEWRWSIGAQAQSPPRPRCVLIYEISIAADPEIFFMPQGRGRRSAQSSNWENAGRKSEFWSRQNMFVSVLRGCSVKKTPETPLIKTLTSCFMDFDGHDFVGRPIKSWKIPKSFWPFVSWFSASLLEGQERRIENNRRAIPSTCQREYWARVEWSPEKMLMRRDFSKMRIWASFFVTRVSFLLY